VALGLPQLRVLWQKELEDHFEVTVIYRRSGAICPRCGMLTTKEHDRRQQRKQDRRLRDKVVFLNLMKRRFKCYCCGKVFTEPDEVFGTRRRSSCRFREYLGREALHQTVSRTAQKEKVGEGLVRRCVAEEVGRRLGVRETKQTPEFMGIDEFSVSGRGKRRDLFKSRYTLLKGVERLADWEKTRLNQLFHRYSELGRAWVLKESFRAWYRETDRMRAEERLELLEERIANSSLPEFKELLHTLTNWREEILNYFDYRITNGFVEGKNNRIKTIKRMAYGYRNMDNFRLRILAANPGCEVRVSHLLT
jgi:transposase